MKNNNIKRIFAIIALILITAWIAATVIYALLPLPGKTLVFPILVAGCVILPILVWILLWGISFLTGKKNIASFRSEEMEKTMAEAETIKADMESKNENSES